MEEFTTMTAKALKIYPYIHVFSMFKGGSFQDFILFNIGYFATKNISPGSRKYIYSTLCNFRLCIGIAWW